MNDIAIRVENLGKQYRIGGPRVRYKTLRESLMGAVTGPFHRLRSAFSKSAIRDPQSEILWALKDVSFDVKRGEVVGIIGRNGAGTLRAPSSKSSPASPSRPRAMPIPAAGELARCWTLRGAPAHKATPS
jgi:lipopolysaccharide transport system ATP-binding protein